MARPSQSGSAFRWQSPVGVTEAMWPSLVGVGVSVSVGVAEEVVVGVGVDVSVEAGTKCEEDPFDMLAACHLHDLPRPQGGVPGRRCYLHGIVWGFKPFSP